MSYAWPDDAAGKLPAQKRPREDAGEPPPAKKRRRDPGEVRLFSANTCGFDAQKWKNIEKMANDHDIDVITLQEGTSKAEVDGIIGEDWESIVTSEKPTDLAIDGHRAVPSVGMARFNVALRRKSASMIVSERPYKPSESKGVKAYVTQGFQAPARAPGKRVVKQPERQTRIHNLGLRPPQALELTLPGHQPVSIYNYHAPQGGGSSQGFSGIDAKQGHEVLSRVVQDDATPHKIVVGDQNAHADNMRRFYPDQEVISAGGKDLLSHAAVSRGLKPKKIDLGTAGDAFNHKGQPGCSDHQPYAFSILLPEHK